MADMQIAKLWLKDKDQNNPFKSTDQHIQRCGVSTKTSLKSDLLAKWRVSVLSPQYWLIS